MVEENDRLEARAENRKKDKAMVAVEGVLPRKRPDCALRKKSEQRTPPAPTKSWKNSDKNSSWGFPGIGSFGSTDYRLSESYRKNKTSPAPKKVQKNGPAAAGPVWPVEEKKTIVKRRADFLAKQVGFMVKDLKVEPPKAKKPEETPYRSPNNPVDKALKRGCPPVVMMDPRKPLSDKNPVCSADKNTTKAGRRFKHEDYNKVAKNSVDAETETEPVRARHVQLSTPVKLGGSIIDPNLYLIENFSEHRVPQLEVELELEKLQKEAVLTKFKAMKEKIRVLEWEKSGSLREKEDALELETLAVQDRDSALRDRDAAIEKAKESAKLVEMWKERAKKQRGEKDVLLKKFDGMQEKMKGKMARALGRLAGAKSEVEIDFACEKLGEMISRDQDEDTETGWSDDDVEC